MKRRILKFLRCPHCLEEFKLQGGKLYCKCFTYNIENNVPVIIKNPPENKTEWDEQWKLYSPEMKLWDTDVKEWENSMIKEHLLLKNVEELKDKIILDAGCGTGLITARLSKYCKQLIALDVSDTIQIAQKRFINIKNLDFVQADLLNLPFKKESFDIIYSTGVLHHIDETEKAFKNLVNCLKRGGRLSIWVYNKDTTIKVKLLEVYFRKLITLVPTKLRKVILYSTIPLFLIKQQIINKNYKQKPMEKLLHIYDALSHKTAKRYSTDEITDLFKNNNLKNILIGRHDESGFTIFGIKK